MPSARPRGPSDADVSGGSDPVPTIAYYETGSIRNRGLMLDGEMHGDWEFFRKDES